MQLSGGNPRRRVAAAAIAVAAIVAVLLLPAASASAGPKDVRYTVKSVGPTAVTAPYGGHWAFNFRFGPKYLPCYSCDEYFRVNLVGASAPYIAHVGDYAGDNVMDFGDYSAQLPPLAVGTYSFNITHHRDQYNIGKTATPVTLTIVPAKVETSVDIQPDPNHPSHAILSAVASGNYVDSVQQVRGAKTVFAVLPKFPAGTWTFSAKNSKGSVVHTARVEAAAGAPPAASSYWTDAPPGEVFSASAVFAPSGSAARNFTVTPAKSVAYTSQAQVAGSTPPATEHTLAPVTTKVVGFAVPTWLVYTWLFVAAVLALLLLATLVRLSRASRSAATPVTAAATDHPHAESRSEEVSDAHE